MFPSPKTDGLLRRKAAAATYISWHVRMMSYLWWQ